jgi:hypothetical protein
MSRYSSAAVLNDDAFMRYDDDDASKLVIEDADTEYRRTKEELDRLKQRQEEMEQKRRELELLEAKRGRYNSGRKDITDRLTRASDSVEKHLDELQLLTKELNVAATSFSAALDQLQALGTDPSRARADELDEAIMVVEEAEGLYAKSCRRVCSIRPDIFEDAALDLPSTGSGLGDDSVKAWLRRGAAFTLPMTAGLLLLLFVAKWLFV